MLMGEGRREGGKKEWNKEPEHFVIIKSAYRLTHTRFMQWQKYFKLPSNIHVRTVCVCTLMHMHAHMDKHSF